MTEARNLLDLTAAQQRIVEWDEGSLVVIAGAGTGKTRVIVERVAHLLGTKGARDGIPPEPAPDHDPFAGPLLPEQILVLTYNVRAAKELAERIEKAVGAAARSRLPVSNFHSFCHRILTDNSAEGGLAANPDVLDGIGQVLLLRDIRPDLPLVYHAGGSNPNYWLDQFVGFINRAKDELVTPADFDAFVERERAAFEQRFGSYETAVERIEALGMVRGTREVRGFYADLRSKERADARGEDVGEFDETPMENRAEREARRAVIGTGALTNRKWLTDQQLNQIDELAATYVIDGAAIEVMRLAELALVYRAYQDELERRGALDFGEQIAAVTQLDRPGRPPPDRRHRDRRLQDRPDRVPEWRRPEPPAVDLRAGRPRRAEPRDAGAGDAVLHRGSDADVDDPDGRPARCGPGGSHGPGGADPVRGLRGHAGQALLLLRLRADVSGEIEIEILR